jgi:hypothetical protein
MGKFLANIVVVFCKDMLMGILKKTARNIVTLNSVFHEIQTRDIPDKEKEGIIHKFRDF